MYVCVTDHSKPSQLFPGGRWHQYGVTVLHVNQRYIKGRKQNKAQKSRRSDSVLTWCIFCVATKFTEVLYLSTGLRYLYLYCYFILSLQYILEANFVLNRPGATSTVNLSPPVVFFKCPFSFVAAMLAPGEAATTVVVVLVEESCTEVVFWLMYLVQP